MKTSPEPINSLEDTMNVPFTCEVNVGRRGLVCLLVVLWGLTGLQAPSARAAHHLYVAEFQSTASSFFSLDDESHDREFWEQMKFAKFWSDGSGRLRGAMSRPGAFHRDLHRDATHGVLMLVHGYNTDVENAVEWARDMPRRLGTQATPLLFRWTSAGRLLAFKSDQFHAFGSGPGLSTLLNHLRTSGDSNQTPVDLVAFSMGSLVVARALVSMPPEGLRHVILLAPALDESLARKVAMWGTRPSGTTTIYVSGHDIALWWARRLGVRPPSKESSDLGWWDVVDVSSACSPSLIARLRWVSKVDNSHDYFSCASVVQDARLALSGVSAKRRGLVKTRTGWRVN